MGTNYRSSCPKSDRCKNGNKCPYGYVAVGVWYSCFDRVTEREKAAMRRRKKEMKGKNK